MSVSTNTSLSGTWSPANEGAFSSGLRLSQVWRRVNPSSRFLDRGVCPIADGSGGRQDAYVTSRILIVDDSPHFRAAAAVLLAARGFEVLESAADGEQALAAVAGECPDGILLDINLPGSDGFAVAARLAAACSQARIVLTSAEVGQVPAQVLRACAAIAFVPKQELAEADLSTFFSG